MKFFWSMASKMGSERSLGGLGGMGYFKANDRVERAGDGTPRLRGGMSGSALRAGILGLAACLLLSATAGTTLAAAKYDEPFRPQFHFSPEHNWMNDPNGMVYHEGEYHLFYQYNPFGIKWGHMSWGHAVSTNMVEWEHLPLALAEENGVMIFSGSAVVDHQNTSGFGKDGKPPLVAIYTGHYTDRQLQNQHIAYSTDKGRAWTKYSGNPVLDIQKQDFRDPKVMWHAPSGRWVMTVALPVERKVQFYGSPNLKEWSLLSEFGPAGAVKGIWECPDLFPVWVEGERPQKWALIVNIGGHSIAGGSGAQYFVGDFDGKTFKADPIAPLGAPDRKAVEKANWADYGRDFYAAVSWSDIPQRDDRRLWLGWMSNWEYAQEVPTTPWRSAMSLPRSLTLRRIGDALKLVQEPVQELQSLRGKHERARLRDVSGPEGIWKYKPADCHEILGVFEPSTDVVFNLNLCQSGDEKTVLRADLQNGVLTLDRTRSGKSDFHQGFKGKYEAPIRLIGGRLKLHIFVDRSSVEVFVNGGETVLTSLILPAADSREIEFVPEKGILNKAEIEVWDLNSIWK